MEDASSSQFLERYPVRIISEKDPQLLQEGEVVSVPIPDSPLRPRGSSHNRTFLVGLDENDEYFRISEYELASGAEIEDGLEFRRRREKPVTPRTFFYADIVKGDHHKELTIAAAGVLATIAAGGVTYLRVKKSRQTKNKN